MANDRQDNGLAVFLAGLALGAVAGILLAPGSGRETRRRVLDASRTLKDKVTEKIPEGLDSLIVEPPITGHRYQEAARAGWKTFVSVLKNDRDSSAPPEG